MCSETGQLTVVAVALEIALGNHLAVVVGRLVHPGLGTGCKGRRAAAPLGVEVLTSLTVGEVAALGDLVGALLGRTLEGVVPGQEREAFAHSAAVLNVDGVLLVRCKPRRGRDNAESGCQSRGNREMHVV